ncbi:MAG: MmcQ/YjbR family DNA-binding protein [Dehalococcoidia bacterium]
MKSVNESPLERVRQLCLALPETGERLSHGAPTFFVLGKRAFVMYLDNHHGDGRLALWCNAPPMAQDSLVHESRPRFFVPPYVGTRGWIGVRLDIELDWDEIGQIIEDAYQATAPKRLLDRMRQ